MKKLLTIALTTALLAGCSSTPTSTTASTETKTRTYKIGVNGTRHETWDHVNEVLKDEGIQLEIVEFTDYVQPNKALSSGDIDLNAFQTVIYFDNFVKENGIDNLAVLGYTQVAPMGIYSKKYTKLEDLPKDKELTVAIPNDTSNGGRAIKFLEQQGFIKVDPNVGQLPTALDIQEYIRPLKIVEMTATQIPSSLPDLDFAVINNGVAYEAGLTLKKDALVYEDYKAKGMESYWNIIAVRKDDVEKDDFKAILKAYQTDETKKIIEEQYDGQSIPVWE